MHILNHIMKYVRLMIPTPAMGTNGCEYRKRQKIIKNDTLISKISSSDLPPEATQDQGFTRPSALLLLPFRSSALSYFHCLSSLLSSQVDNQDRFIAEYGLPPGAVDKLTTEVGRGKWPEDHVATFAGNIDDNFRVGVSLKGKGGKGMKMFTEFFKADLVIASPLGLRMAIEKDGNADFLSSIEVLVVDQVDVMTMQNWDHVQVSHILFIKGYED